VECANGTPDDANATMTMMLAEPTTEATPASCDAEVKECPNGVFVAKAPELACDFYPCPEGDVVEASSTESVLSGWGSTPLSHSCTSDGSGSCGLCHGDCGSDEDCQEGLLCFSRGEGEVTPVPGCISGGEGDLPGMDYCYSPFPPATTTAATTTITTIMVTTSTTMVEETNTMGNLDFARECTESEPCGVCEGDCDNDMQCGDGLKCFSRVKGSVDLVPGCLGLGIDGEFLLVFTVSLLCAGFISFSLWYTVSSFHRPLQEWITATILMHPSQQARTDNQKSRKVVPPKSVHAPEGALFDKTLIIVANLSHAPRMKSRLMLQASKTLRHPCRVMQCPKRRRQPILHRRRNNRQHQRLRCHQRRCHPWQQV
jgi:hypothetical protein